MNLWQWFNRYGTRYAWLALKMKRRQKHPSDRRWQRISTELRSRLTRHSPPGASGG